MTDTSENALLELIRNGALVPGTVLHCALRGISCEVTREGLRIADQVFANPHAAMRHVLPPTHLAGNGWLFWHLPDPLRGYIKPLEHLRVTQAGRHLSNVVKTSRTHPLRVDSLVVRGLPGRIGMTFCPGKKGPSLFSGQWNRDLAEDIEAIKRFGATDLVTLLERHEFSLIGVPDFATAVSSSGLRWHWCPIRDSDVPSGSFEGSWPALRESMHAALAAGGNVVVHCRGGLGRTGVVVGRFLISEGYEPEEAIALLRQTRPGALETWEQEEHVRQWRVLA